MDDYVFLTSYAEYAAIPVITREGSQIFDRSLLYRAKEIREPLPFIVTPRYSKIQSIELFGELSQTIWIPDGKSRGYVWQTIRTEEDSFPETGDFNDELYVARVTLIDANIPLRFNRSQLEVAASAVTAFFHEKESGDRIGIERAVLGDIESDPLFRKVLYLLK